jgi:hypothetical protein
MKSLVCANVDNGKTFLGCIFYERLQSDATSGRTRTRANTKLRVVSSSQHPDKSYACSCGAIVSPENYLAGMERFKAVANLALRVTIPAIFASLINRDDVESIAAHTSLS